MILFLPMTKTKLTDTPEAAKPVLQTWVHAGLGPIHVATPPVDTSVASR